MNKIDLNGRKAVVTGGARGIGLAIVERLLDSGAGCSLWDRDSAALESAAKSLRDKGQVQTAVVSINDPASVKAATEQTLKAFGTIDILVNNAGIAGVTKKSWEFTPQEWREVIDTNLTGVFLCCNAIVPAMLAKKYGRIVNIASIAGKEGNPNAAHYSAAKAGVIALTKSLGKELAGYEIAVNAVTPAAAKTAIFDQLTQQHIDFMLSKTPKGRFVLVEELAAMVAWLASEDCAFSTGAVFDISGGRATY